MHSPFKLPSSRMFGIPSLIFGRDYDIVSVNISYSVGFSIGFK